MKLIFVYNADSDLLSKTKDFVHKALSPESYVCNLCKITYGVAVMKQEWRDFINESNIDMEFLHKDEFIKKYPNLKNQKLPAVFLEENNDIKTFIPAEEIDKIESIKELKNLINNLNV
ncbi:MAG: hypothetical protein WDZ80_07650 [Candidatus Paceibacterota bacterium]